MKKLLIIAVIYGSYVASVYADCDGEEKILFSCITTSGKQIELCDHSDTIRYSFGRLKTKPEIVLSVPRGNASTSQWQGTGRYITYSVDVPNGDTTYSVFSSFDRVPEENKSESGVNVLVKGELKSRILCKKDQIVSNLEGVDLKHADQEKLRTADEGKTRLPANSKQLSEDENSIIRMVKASQESVASFKESGVSGMTEKIIDCHAELSKHMFYCVYLDVASRYIDLTVKIYGIPAKPIFYGRSILL